MRVLHVSTYRNGGAGIAALRLHKGLLAAGVNSEFLCLDHDTVEITRKVPLPKVPPPSLFKRVLVKLKKKFLHETITIPELHINSNLHSLQAEYEAFTSPVTEFDLTKHPAYQAADLINLHWVADFIDFPSFFSKNTKPLVWTLHDMNPLLGGFHYLGDVNTNRHLASIDQEYKVVKQNAFSIATNIHIVALSKWLLHLSTKELALKKFPHYHIPNGLDINIFKPLDKNFSRQVLGLPANKMLVLFVCEKLSVRRKGFDLLQDVISRFSNENDIMFCAVGIQDVISRSNCIYLDTIRDERLMAVVYAACDVFVIPSREDNLPNVMLEALACGTPVVATPVGGVPDVVVEPVNGVLANNVSSEALYDALQVFIKIRDTFNRNKIREHFLESYSIEKQVSAYKTLYSKIISQEKIYEANKHNVEAH
jgi:glycosyltransferase involved in cell wall biosynthesis